MPSETPNQFLALLKQREPDIKIVLPSYINPERFFTLARTVNRNQELAGCSPESKVECVMQAAERGLEIGGPEKHCAVVKFKSTAVLIVQWQGKAFLWHRAGAIKSLIARVVYDGDQFDLEEGDSPRIFHKPDYRAERGPKWLNDLENIVGAYAIATLPDSSKTHSFVSHSQLVRLREWVKSKNEGKLGFGWRDWLPEMCCKTATHRLDGYIQAPLNPNPAQVEAWERVGRVIETTAQHIDPETGEVIEADLARASGELQAHEKPKAKAKAGNAEAPQAGWNQDTLAEMRVIAQPLIDADAAAFGAVCQRFGIKSIAQLPREQAGQFVAAVRTALEAAGG
jgi:phage RecT family recombinase